MQNLDAMYFNTRDQKGLLTFAGEHLLLLVSYLRTIDLIWRSELVPTHISYSQKDILGYFS